MSQSLLPSLALYAARSGLEVNLHGRFYQRGKAYSLDIKMHVATTLLDHMEKKGPFAHGIVAAVGRECHVGWEYVKKVRDELLTEGIILDPKEIYERRTGDLPSGPGSRSLDDGDCFVLYQLYRKDPSRSLKSYVNWLYYFTGTIVSKSTVSRWFNHGFPYKGGLRKANIQPFDKFKPANIEKAYEYLAIMARIDPTRIKFGDEKHLKGKDIVHSVTRRDVLTGIVPPVTSDPDWRNAFSIIGICGIDRRSSPVRYRITSSTVDAELFAIEIEAAVASGFLRAGDVLVLDNCIVHRGKENTVLEEWLWEDHQIYIVWLPARTPEWNPIELLWNCLAERLKHMSSEELVEIPGNNRVVKAAVRVLEGMTHKNIFSFYEKSGVFDSYRNNNPYKEL